MSAAAARVGLFGAVTVLAVGCGSNFDPPSLVKSLRILATQADKPYAMPGEAVNMQVLAVDARADKSRPMNVYWVPQPCENPANDLYYGCYPSFSRSYAAGATLDAELSAGATFTFTMPEDAIAAHPSQAGASEPYGLVFVFTIACAGHVRYVPSNPATQSPTTTPFDCFDDAGNALGADGFVFAFTRVYAFATRRNANPIIDHLTYRGAGVDHANGVALPHCTASSEANCSTTDIDTVLPDSSWELDPGDVDANGHVAHESLWVDYYITAGQLKNDAALLFDAHSGRVLSTGDGYHAPLAGGEDTLWVVAHDNRGGASWLTVPIHAQ